MTDNKKLLSRSLIIRATMIIAVSSVLALAVNALRPSRIPLFQEWNLRDLAVCSDGRRIPWLTKAESQALFEGGEGLFLDARPPDEYTAEHIAGAVNLPYDEFDEYLGALAGQLSAYPCLVTYCDGTDCHSSIELAIKLCDSGFADVKVFFGGINEWKEAGLPIEH